MKCFSNKCFERSAPSSVSITDFGLLVGTVAFGCPRSSTAWVPHFKVVSFAVFEWALNAIPDDECNRDSFASYALHPTHRPPEQLGVADPSPIAAA
jgi:hypothetical protein